MYFGIGLSLAIGGVRVAPPLASQGICKDAFDIFLEYSFGIFLWHITFSCTRVTPILVTSKGNMLRCLWHILEIFLLD